MSGRYGRTVARGAADAKDVKVTDANGGRSRSW
jgi:hypothetical protein